MVWNGAVKNSSTKIVWCFWFEGHRTWLGRNNVLTEGKFLVRVSPRSKLATNSYPNNLAVNLKPNSLLTPNFMTKNSLSGTSQFEGLVVPGCASPSPEHCEQTWWTSRSSLPNPCTFCQSLSQTLKTFGSVRTHFVWPWPKPGGKAPKSGGV